VLASRRLSFNRLQKGTGINPCDLPLLRRVAKANRMTPLTQPNWRFLEIVINENDGTFGLRAFRWPHKLASGLTWDEAVKQGEEFERKLNSHEKHHRTTVT